MPKKTNSEIISEIQLLTTTLAERVNNDRSELNRVREQVAAANSDIAELKTSFKQQESRLDDLRKESDNRVSRRWALMVTIISALLAAGLSFAVQVILQTYVLKKP